MIDNIVLAAMAAAVTTVVVGVICLLIQRHDRRVCIRCLTTPSKSATLEDGALICYPKCDEG